MRKWLRRIGWGVAGLLAVLVVVLAAGLVWGSWKFNRAVSRRHAVAPVRLSRSASRGDARNGEYLARYRHTCVYCHGDDLAGGKMKEPELMVGVIHGPNLTPAALHDWTDGEIARAIHHGVGRDGRSLQVMPANEYSHMSERDLLDLIAFLRHLPPVAKPNGPVRVAAFLKFFYAIGQLPIAIPVEVIDHAAPFPPDPPRGANARRGDYYFSMMCVTCHMADRRGGSIMPGMPAAASLTPEALGTWTEAQFLTTLRTGVNPSGHTLNPMMGDIITKGLSHWHDEDLRALWAFLQTPVQGARAAADF